MTLLTLDIRASRGLCRGSRCQVSRVPSVMFYDSRSGIRVGEIGYRQLPYVD